MYDESLIESLYGMLSGSNAPMTKRQFIHDFRSFILDHIPYASVTEQALQMGLVQFDGPAAKGVDNNKPPLVWYFGGVPYPIVKAAMIQYNYKRDWDGSGQTVYASIVLGFQSNLPQQLHPSPKAHTVTSTGDFLGDLTKAIHSVVDRMPGTVVSRQSNFHGLDWLINDELASINSGFRKRLQGARAQSSAITRGTAQVMPPLPEAHGASEQTPAAQDGDPSADSATTNHGTNGHPVTTTEPMEVVVQMPGTMPPLGLSAIHPGPYTVEFDGPARDHDSQHIFAYTLETLFNDQELFSQILWWYFGGHPVRITKAMRIPIRVEPDPQDPNAADGGDLFSLFVGYSGPGTYP